MPDAMIGSSSTRNTRCAILLRSPRRLHTIKVWRFEAAHQLGAVGDPQLAVDAREVLLHCDLRYVELPGDIAVRVVAENQQQDFVLAPRDLSSLETLVQRVRHGGLLVTGADIGLGYPLLGELPVDRPGTA